MQFSSLANVIAVALNTRFVFHNDVMPTILFLLLFLFVSHSFHSVLAHMFVCFAELSNQACRKTQQKKNGVLETKKRPNKHAKHNSKTTQFAGNCQSALALVNIREILILSSCQCKRYFVFISFDCVGATLSLRTQHNMFCLVFCYSFHSLHHQSGSRSPDFSWIFVC